MKTKISNSGVCLLLATLSFGAAQATTACSSAFRTCYETRTCPASAGGDDAGAGGSDDSGGTGSKGGGSGAGGSAKSSAAGAKSGASEGRAAGEGGASGEGGAAGTTCGDDCACDGRACDCKAGDQRSCAAAGLLGSCAAGVQACGADRHWGACSIQPKSKDTCAPSNDDTCDGVVNEGCPCVQGQQRPCSDGGLVGKCAAGKQTCGSDAKWGACSITPAASDSCQQGNNDNCVGPANEGCLCIEGVTTRPCGVCQDGTQTCTNGATGQFGACVGGTNMTTYYLDADGDGHAVNVSTTICGAPPAHYITGPVDDCYDSNADAFPGQTTWFSSHRGDGSFDYDCDNTEETYYKKGDDIGCATCNASCSDCATHQYASGAASCGEVVSIFSCYAAPNCGVHPYGGPQGCH